MQDDLLPSGIFGIPAGHRSRVPTVRVEPSAAAARQTSTLFKKPLNASAHISARIGAALAAAARSAASGVVACGKYLLVALNESRDREAARLIARYRPADDGCRFERAEMEISRQPPTSRLGPLSESEIMMFKSNSKAAE